MKHRLALLSAVMIALLFVLPSFAVDDGSEDQTTVVAVKGAKSFTIQEKEVVRIEAGGIAGATISAKVTGNAKLKKYTVRRVVEGIPVVGLSGVEYEVCPTGKGKVTVDVSVKNPPDAKPRITNYEFVIQ